MAKPAKTKSLHRCQACGQAEPKWLGRCPGCNEWNSMVEELPVERSISASRMASAAASGSSGEPGFAAALPGGGGKPVRASDALSVDAAPRLSTGLGELDRVLGGGLVAGALVLLGGEPGIGKSTLLLQALDGLARHAPVLYVSGEESIAQTALRARRVNAARDDLRLLSETGLERILAAADALRPCALAIDSVQTVHTDALEGIPGSIGQVRECAARLMTWAKTTGIPVILIGHVTKDGAIAGPKTLEHLVDTVLSFEGEGAHPYRILRALKNRFGSTAEVGVFEMRAVGLTEVENPSALFLSERPVGAPGSVVVASADGARPILVEVQALVAPPAAGIGRRTAVGVDANRVSLLLAVLAERAGCDAIERDVFVNVAGGVRLTEPAIDLGVACAIASAAWRAPVAEGTVVFGEVGLAGEVRGVSLVEVRLAEARKLGFERVVLPRTNVDRGDRGDRGDRTAQAGLELVGVQHVKQALAALFERAR